MYTEISNSCSCFLKAILFDLAEQREVSATEFRLVRSFRTENRTKFFFRADQFGLVIPLIVEKRSGSRCLVKIGAGTVVEQNSIRYRLMRLAVLPELLETAVGDDGAYLLSVGAGVLADFRERPYTVNADRIYMEQREWEKMSMMNCFGRIHAAGNVLAVVESGDFHCRVVSEYNDRGRNRIFAEFEMRSGPSEMLKYEDKTLLFISCHAGSGYSGLAFAYREYLLEHGMDTLKTRMEGNPVLQYSAEAVRVKIFMAVKEPYVPDGSSTVKVLTNCDEACIILDGMKAGGIEKAVVTLVGWNLGGHDGAYPAHFPVEPAIGGEKGLRKLIAYAGKLGYQIVPHDNVTDIYRGSPDFDYEYVARNEGGEPLAAGVWGGGQSYKACPRVFLERYGYEFERIRNLGFAGHYYMDAQSTVMWRCHAGRHPADEREFALALSAITTVPRMLYGAVSAEGAAAYILPFIDEVSRLHTPLTAPEMLKKCPPALRSLNPRPVPFYHIALHGLLLYQDHWVHGYRDVKRGLLYELVLGARPSMEISYRTDGGNGGDYRKCIEMLKESCRWCYQELKVQCELVTSFSEPEDGFYEIVYANGTGIRVNLTDHEVNGVPSESWLRF